MTTLAEPLHILVAGPYRSGTGDDPKKIQANVDAMMEVALRLFRAGHLQLAYVMAMSLRHLGRLARLRNQHT